MRQPGTRACTGYALHFFDAGVGQKGSDKFYRGFWYVDAKGTYRVVTNWGRDGAVGQMKVDEFTNQFDAEKLLDKKRHEKVRHGYEILGQGTQLIVVDSMTTLQAAALFASLVAERDADKTRMTGGILIHEEPDLMDLLG